MLHKLDRKDRKTRIVSIKAIEAKSYIHKEHPNIEAYHHKRDSSY